MRMIDGDRLMEWLEVNESNGRVLNLPDVRFIVSELAKQHDIEDAGREPVILCKNCKHAVLTYSGDVKYCTFWQSDEDGDYCGDPLYLDGDFYCAAGMRKDGEGDRRTEGGGEVG